MANDTDEQLFEPGFYINKLLLRRTLVPQQVLLKKVKPMDNNGCKCRIKLQALKCAT